jgi:hypothetical protein
MKDPDGCARKNFRRAYNIHIRPVILHCQSNLATCGLARRPLKRNPQTWPLGIAFGVDYPHFLIDFNLTIGSSPAIAPGGA